MLRHQAPAVRGVHRVAIGIAAPVPPARPARVFIPAPARPSDRLIRRRRVLLAVAAVVAGTVVSLLRPVGFPATDTLWAEDASLFLSDAVLEPFPRALFASYNGYFLLPSRLLAELIALFPASWAAPLMAITAAAVNSLLALLVYVASAAVLRSTPLRLSVAAVALLTPVGAYEVPNSLANLQWAALYALFWVAVWVPATRAGRIVAVGTGLAVATTTILAVLFLPLIGLRTLMLRRRPSTRPGAWGLLVAVGAGVLLQLGGLLFGASSREGLKVDLGTAFGRYVERLLPTAIGGDRLVGQLDHPAQPGWLWFGWAVLGLTVLIGLWRWRTANWGVAGLALLYSLLLWLATAGLSPDLVTRYTTTPAMLVVTAVAALLVPARVSTAPAASTVDSADAAGRWLPVALVVMLTLTCIGNLRAEMGREVGPGWSAALGQARAACASVGPQTRVLVPISPPGWRARLPCSYLRRS